MRWFANLGGIYYYCGDFRRDFVRGNCLRSLEGDHKMN